MSSASKKPVEAAENARQIVISDDHTGCRPCVIEYLQGKPNLQIAGIASDVPSTIELARVLEPDVVIIDLNPPALVSLEAIQRIRHELPAVKVLAVSALDDEHMVLNALHAGANGYLLNTATGAVVVDAIQQAIAGEWPLDPVIDRLLSRWAPMPHSAQSIPMPRTALITPSEREVLGLMACGLTNREISGALFVNVRTVQTLLSSIFTKLRAVSRLDAVLTAARHGWIDGSLIRE